MTYLHFTIKFIKNICIQQVGLIRFQMTYYRQIFASPITDIIYEYTDAIKLKQKGLKEDMLEALKNDIYYAKYTKKSMIACLVTRNETLAIMNNWG